MGRTRLLRESETTSVRLGRQDKKHLHGLLQVMVQYDAGANKSLVIRDALAIAHAHVRQQEFTELQRLRERIQEEERRRRDVEEERDRLQKIAERAQKAAKKTKRQIDHLTRHLPTARYRAERSVPGPSGIVALDQLWMSCGKSWPRVVARLEEVERGHD